jgi:methyltransferase (TIGR00027 family)
MSVVAVEQNTPERQRLVQDALAIRFLPPMMKPLVIITRWSSARALMVTLADKRGRGVWGGVLCRKRYIDDKLLEAVRAGLDVVVNLGAGLDTRAYRLPDLTSLPVFELDYPENIEYKKAKLRQLFGGIPPHVTLVPIDFDRQDLGIVLGSYGYRTTHKSFFIMEAVTQYLSEDGIHNIFRFLAQATTGSRLVFTYICQDFMNGTVNYGLRALYEAYRVKTQLWHFGLEPKQVAAFLGQYTWKEVEQVGNHEYTLRYLDPIGRTMSVLEIERAVYAEKLHSMDHILLERFLEKRSF